MNDHRDDRKISHDKEPEYRVCSPPRTHTHSRPFSLLNPIRILFQPVLCFVLCLLKIYY